MRNERRGNLFISRRLLRSYLPRNDRKIVIRAVFVQALTIRQRVEVVQLVSVLGLRQTARPGATGKDGPQSFNIPVWARVLKNDATDSR